jgi:hypothetical protein
LQGVLSDGSANPCFADLRKLIESTQQEVAFAKVWETIDFGTPTASLAVAAQFGCSPTSVSQGKFVLRQRHGGSGMLYYETIILLILPSAVVKREGAS